MAIVWSEEGGEGKEGGSDCTNWITRTKAEAESVGFIEVERIGVQDAEVHLPLFVIICGDQADTGREGLVDLVRGRTLEESGKG